MSGTVAIKGVFEHLDSLLTGLDRLRKSGYSGYTVVSPTPRHEIEHALYEGRPSPVRWWTLAGGVLGVIGGLLLTTLTAAQWPMINPGGKPIVALLPYAVVIFECTILFAGFSTFAGLLVHCGLPAFWLDRALTDPRTSDASFTIVFTAAPYKERNRIASLLERAGAVEVTTDTDTAYEVPNE